MAINVTKPAINLREKLNEVTLETGIKGEELLNSDTSTEARNVLELDTHLFTDFESTGIDDNATSTAITIDASENTTFAGDVSLGDNVKAKFGAGNDLQIYHDGGHSYIKENGTGQLFVEGTELRLRDSAGANYFGGNTGAEAFISYAGLTKLATTSTGIDVTGSVTCDGFTSTGIDDNATSTAITIDASEHVGIGTTAPDRLLHLAGADTAIIRLENTDTTLTSNQLIGAIEFEQQDASGSGVGVAASIKVNSDAPNGDNSRMTFHTASSSALDVERMRIDRDGTVTVNTGNLVIGTSGKGIDFSADGNAAGMTSEVLDDYETGTWTPTASSGTLNNWYGRYTKVGNQVTVSAYFRGQSTGSSTVLGGLPFSTASVSTAKFAGSTSQVGGSVLSGTASVDASNNTTVFKFRVIGVQEYIAHNENIAMTLTYLTD